MSASDPLRTFKHRSQSCAMKVMLVFDRAYGQREERELGDAFWLIESPSNYALAERAWKTSSTDANSAVFKATWPVSTEAVCGKVGDIDLHHPEWSEIVVVGFGQIDSLKVELDLEGFAVMSVSGGLSITRKVG